MSEKTQNTTFGIGFGGMLAILFIGLKLTNFIDWSWWWVLSPLWIPAVVVLAFLAIVFVVAFCCSMVASLLETKSKPRKPFRG